MRKTPAELKCPVALAEEFIAVVDDNVRAAPIMADNDSLELVESLKNTIDADSKDENEMNNAAPVPTSSGMRNVLKSIRSFLDEHSNGEMDKKDDIERFVVKKTMQKNISDYFPKIQSMFLFFKKAKNFVH
ncbi:hypothetical protein TNCV_328601 [Trichonephila clavipes]|nr:hypothetical protein TNCV_328601 [Trichonephila clavipes]